MELTLTPKQKKYLDESGPMKAATLRIIYKKSVQDQQKTLKQAERVLAERHKNA
jgi:hypothetical protein